ncbi:glycosyltransferase [Actinoplanes sp. NPDC051494]|uniref:glycosyltransferase n=1 Tax=Actinoplanes sp. NPDC051494 TaxID=3363907 RepID=UPI00379AF5BB
MAETPPAPLTTTQHLLGAPPGVSVVVPTRNEADNVGPLVDRVRSAFGARTGEVVFVDDSDDDTPAAIQELADRFPGEVRLVHRVPGARDGGLGGAVVAGISAARAPWVVVMDGDLQHPPETVPELLAAGRAETAQAVVASRYRTTGRVTGLGGWFRRTVSRGTGLLAKVFFPVRLRAVSDPMSGFFAVRRDAVRVGELRPDGYKILLEVLVRNRIDRITEVAYTFQPRTAGESKASIREGMRYFRHLAGLRLSTLRRPHSAYGRMLGFAVAGAAGTAVNSVALWALGELAGLPYLLAAFLAVQVAIVWNFAVIDHLVMPPGERARRHRFGRFLLLNNSLTPIHLGLLFALVRWGGLHYLGANVIAIGVVFALRYAVTTSWVYDSPALPTSGVLRVVRRAAQVRVVLAVLLTALAFPALLRLGATPVPLVIPFAAAAALVLGRLRPEHGEPDVHDRQLDGLLAVGCLASATTLLLLAPAPDRMTWVLPAALFYLAGAAVLLLGTRTAARLRWILPIPLVSLAAVPALAGAIACVVLGALVVFGPRLRTLLHAGTAAAVLGAVSLVTGQPVLLALVVAGFAAAWSRTRITATAGAAGRPHLPRARYALVTLVLVAAPLALTLLTERGNH